MARSRRSSTQSQSPSLNDRIPFVEAIADPLLLKGPFDKLSGPQQSALKVFYGLPLDEQGLRHYAMFMGDAEYDSLGYIKKVEPATNYSPREHDEAYLVLGRRSGKTSGFLSFIVAYEALLGGHSAWAGPKQRIAVFVVAQLLEIAQSIIRDFVEPIISSSPILEKEIVKNNTDGILLRNGVLIAPAPPVIKNFRYWAIPVVVMDEAAFWYKDAESANPDYEVLRAVAPAQAQFPDRKLVVASTVWSKQGVIWEAMNAGNYGIKLAEDDERKPRFEHALVLTAPSPAMENPRIQEGGGRKWFEKEYRKDPDAYRREILNMAVDAVAGLFAETLLRKATENAPPFREWQEGEEYVAAIDPAFRGDDFTFTIGHYTRESGFYQDHIQRWSPQEMKLIPSIILDEIKVKLDEYKLDSVFSDQYQLESLQDLASDRGFSIIGIDFTASSKAKFFGSFLQILRNDRVHLLRHHEQFLQFLWIQRFLGSGGYVRISAPVGKKDDLVLVTVLCASMALRMEPAERKAKEVKPPTPYEIIMAKLFRPKEPDAEWL